MGSQLAPTKNASPILVTQLAKKLSRPTKTLFPPAPLSSTSLPSKKKMTYHFAIVVVSLASMITSFKLIQPNGLAEMQRIWQNSRGNLLWALNGNALLWGNAVVYNLTEQFAFRAWKRKGISRSLSLSLSFSLPPSSSFIAATSAWDLIVEQIGKLGPPTVDSSPKKIRNEHNVSQQYRSLHKLNSCIQLPGIRRALSLFLFCPSPAIKLPLEWVNWEMRREWNPFTGSSTRSNGNT